MSVVAVAVLLVVVAVVVVGGCDCSLDDADSSGSVGVVVAMAIANRLSFSGDSSSFDLSGDGHEGSGECEFHCKDLSNRYDFTRSLLLINLFDHV